MITMMNIRTYSELIKLPTLRERFEYLKLDGVVGVDTFGRDRYVNQTFYQSAEWNSIKRRIILRDHGCDLGVDGYEIFDKIIIHHMNPITIDDVLNHTPYLIDPEYLICTRLDTHNAIHYGDVDRKLPNEMIIRRPNDTCPWRQ